MLLKFFKLCSSSNDSSGVTDVQLKNVCVLFCKAKYFPSFFLCYNLAHLRSRDATFRVSVVTAISDMKIALVGEGDECQHLALIITGDVISVINSDRDDSVFVVYINSDI